MSTRVHASVAGVPETAAAAPTAALGADEAGAGGAATSDSADAAAAGMSRWLSALRSHTGPPLHELEVTSRGWLMYQAHVSMHVFSVHIARVTLA
jgi:hypothetical protein